MRLVIQRVREASVTVGGEVVGSIGRGLVVLCGLERSDDQAAAEWAERRICGIRLFENADDKAWAASVASAGLEVLLVSQFTLLAVLKGHKPDFSKAMGPAEARPFFDGLVRRIGAALPGRLQTGRFGEHMDVRLANDGPVTIELQSPAV